MKILLQLLLLILLSVSIYANTITGIIVDEQKNPLPGANITIEGSILGAASINNGFFQIKNVPVGKFVVSITMIGFKEKNVEIDIIENSNIDIGEIQLISSPIASLPIIVTASKHKQNINDVPVSISLVNKSEIEIRNNITIEDALKFVPGVNMNQDQINIRGSSGYSRGVGSRVMMLVDGVPYIAGDTQGTVPEALAINQVENIEIVKGASSALYGSSAIGGVINIITKSIDENPKFSFKVYGGLYDDPYYKQWNWSSGSRYKHGLKAGYSRKIENTGFRFAISQDRDDSFRKNDWGNRVNFSGKIEHDFSAFEKLSISGNYMDQKRGDFLYWESLDNALVPAESQIGNKVHSVRYFLNPSYRLVLSDSNFINIKAIWFHNYFNDNIDIGNQSTSDNINFEFQHHMYISNHFITYGVSSSLNRISSNIFNSDTLAINKIKSHSGYEAAAYIQDEIKWNKQITTTIGARLDYIDIEKLGKNIALNPKIGFVYKPHDLTVIRASVGTGFRSPSMAEAFASTIAGGIKIIPNEELKPEKSYSAELGWNQIFSNNLYTDIAIFYNRYFDLIESGFTQEKNAQFNNVTDAEISGLDFSIHFNLLNKSINSSVGYTFIEPRNITDDKSEYLKYRPRHLLYTNANWNYRDFLVGIDYRFISEYDKIDEEFASIITDGDETVDVHVVDVRISQKFKLGSFPVRATLQINNLLQYNYIDLIGTIAPIRTFILSLETSL